MTEREKDKRSAYIEDYLELCRRYGLCVTTDHDPEYDLIIDNYNSRSSYDWIIKEPLV